MHSNEKYFPTVAIVILNWNGKAYLEKFLPIVLKSSYENKTVIVADNASTDDSVLFLRNHYPGVRLIENAANEGFASGYNKALQQVNSEYCILLNSDVEVTEQWIEPVIAIMEANKKIAACQPKILSFKQKKYFEYAGAAGGWIDSMGYPFSRGRVFDCCETDNGQYNNASPCFWATGTAMFVRTEVFKQLAGFDESFFAHQEEIDLCWRMQLAGYAVFVQPASVVYHIGGGTLPSGNSRKVYLNYRNNLVMLYKNLPVSEKIWKIPVRLVLDGIAACRELVSADAGYFMAVIKAHMYFYGWLIGKKKKNKFTPKRLTGLHGVYKGLLIWEYFIKKKKAFAEIVGNNS
ncbi:MAG: glycosyltransferase family 2 protein [Chitinophagaceae bacterium]|nr:glycosyltransferase family 2 protein [Chitinophagaceae bacterium]MBK7089462.1 glycosyltransferase family 2 protein [Chitinophagaceae bacterium]MBK8775023.1 glycosyltransferase family 2 protein [Chitinophagaceae bacterium]MBK8928959.1 glycosyltransferase family 2 protein [Chitinophagaceae bacterium]MBL0253632.1 glycosyltransferase family 2 protein [Chitinophagaceae bacterium]